MPSELSSINGHSNKNQLPKIVNFPSAKNGDENKIILN